MMSKNFLGFFIVFFLNFKILQPRFEVYDSYSYPEQENNFEFNDQAFLEQENHFAQNYYDDSLNLDSNQGLEDNFLSVSDIQINDLPDEKIYSSLSDIYAPEQINQVSEILSGPDSITDLAQVIQEEELLTQEELPLGQEAYAGSGSLLDGLLPGGGAVLGAAGIGYATVFGAKKVAEVRTEWKKSSNPSLPYNSGGYYNQGYPQQDFSSGYPGQVNYPNYQNQNLPGLEGQRFPPALTSKKPGLLSRFRRSRN